MVSVKFYYKIENITVFCEADPQLAALPEGGNIDGHASKP
jgi:hypothetical protein